MASFESMNPADYEPYASLGLAIAAGLILGVEREQSAGPKRAEHTFLGGSRTYPLVAMLGAISMLLSAQLGAWVVASSFAGVLLFLVIAYVDDVRRDRGRGITSEMALLLTYALGALSLSDVFDSLQHKAIVVASLSVVSTLLLSIKPELHAAIRHLSKEDVYSTLKLLVVSVVMLPLLPDVAMGPLDSLNPRRIGVLAVLIAGIGFCGYVLIRFMGTHRGLMLTGLVGGFVSSTAVTLSFSGRARRTPEMRAACTVAVVAASSIMFIRVIVEVAIVHPSLVGLVAVPAVAAMLAGLLASLYFYRRARRDDRRVEQEISFSNPFQLTHALGFAAIFAIVLMATRLASEYLGQGGLYLTGFLAGLTQVDAITLSMAGMARDGAVSPQLATSTILTGAASNTVAKAGVALIIGRGAFGRGVALSLAVVLAAGAGAYAIVAAFT